MKYLVVAADSRWSMKLPNQLVSELSTPFVWAKDIKGGDTPGRGQAGIVYKKASKGRKAANMPKPMTVK